MGAKSYRDLIAWQRAMDFASAVHTASKGFPTDERFGLTSQLRRSAVSVPSNIAEGEGRSTHAEFRRFLAIAHGSLCEAETQLLLAERFGYLAAEAGVPIMDTAAETGRLIKGLIRSLKDK